MENLNGIFKLEIDGKERDLKCDFSTVEKLERDVFGRPIMAVLNEGINGHVSITDVVNTIMVGLDGNGDTRFKRDDIGAEVIKKGLVHYIEWYLSFLTYSITGSSEVEAEKVSDKDPDAKKK